MSEWRGSPHGYGLINPMDIAFLERHLERMAGEFSRKLRILELGVACGYTAKGIAQFCAKQAIELQYHGIDGECGRPHPNTIPDGGVFHLGDTREIFDQIPDGFHLVFIDACHCNNCVMLDFLNYAPKVVVGGYALFHDTNSSPKWQGLHENHWQGHGPKTAPFCVATRMAIKKLGLADSRRSDWIFVGEQDEGDALGMMLFKKVL